MLANYVHSNAAAWDFSGLPSGYDEQSLAVRHGIDGTFIDGLPTKNGDFPWLC